MIMDRGGRARIVSILPRGEAIRNFVYSGALDCLAEFVDLDVLSVYPSGTVRKLLASRYRLNELKEYPERWPVRILRELLDMAHGRWLWSQAAQERWRLRDLEATATRPRLKRWAKKAACAPFASRAGLGVISRLERGASRLLRTTDAYLDLFCKLRPSLVFNGSHVHSPVATQAVQAAQWLGIKTATFIFSWDNLTSQGRIMLPYDYYLVWNEQLRRQLLEIYPRIRPERVFVTGTPQFDPHFEESIRLSREEFCAVCGADPARPIVLYTTGMPNHMPHEPEIVEGIADMLKALSGPPQLLVRVYPKDRTGRFEPLRARRADILFQEVPWESAWLTPLPEDGPLLTNTLLHADVGINVASTVSLELAMFDKPVLNVGYNPPSLPTSELEYARYYRFDHYAPVVGGGGVRVAGSPGELSAFLREELADPGRGSTARKALVQEMFGDTLDGRSGSRVAKTLATLACSTRSPS